MVYFSLCVNTSDRLLLAQLKMIPTVTIVFHVHRIEKRLEMVPHGVNMNRTHGFFTSPKTSTTPSRHHPPSLGAIRALHARTARKVREIPAISGHSPGKRGRTWIFWMETSWSDAIFPPNRDGKLKFQPQNEFVLSHHHFCFVATKTWDLNGFKLKSAKIRTYSIYYRLTEISCSTNSGSSVVCRKSGMTGPMHSLHPSSFVKVSQVSHSYNC